MEVKPLASRIPPTRHFRNDRRIFKADVIITRVINLVEHEEEITTGTVDVVNQKVLYL